MRLLRASGCVLAMVLGLAGIEDQAGAASGAFETLVSTRSTSVGTSAGLEDVSWNISSVVGAVDASSVDPSAPGTLEFLRKLSHAGMRMPQLYRYTYTFVNPSKIPLKMNFSDPKLANSPLTVIFDDYSFTLRPGQMRYIQFLAIHAPDFVVSSVNDSIWDQGAEQWDPLGSGPASLYVPSWSGPIFIEAQ
jgi:hypothetical protein